MPECKPEFCGESRYDKGQSRVFCTIHDDWCDEIRAFVPDEFNEEVSKTKLGLDIENKEGK
ncbi:hypothetical protein AGMMS49944_03860 [Spirochaetia bacterium]|nr:hypothetical protein AGMMS49944_03860 [Spirochaetia bacterium]